MTTFLIAAAREVAMGHKPALIIGAIVATMVVGYLSRGGGFE